MYRISGIAAIPTQSLNGEIYAADSFRKIQNLSVPLTKGHGGEVVGSVTLNWNEEDYVLAFEGQSEIPDIPAVSIGVIVTKYQYSNYFDATTNTYVENQIILESVPFELSIVDNPAIPFVQVQVNSQTKEKRYYIGTKSNIKVEEIIETKEKAIVAKEEVKQDTNNEINININMPLETKQTSQPETFHDKLKEYVDKYLATKNVEPMLVKLNEIQRGSLSSRNESRSIYAPQATIPTTVMSFIGQAIEQRGDTFTFLRLDFKKFTQFNEATGTTDAGYSLTQISKQGNIYYIQEKVTDLAKFASGTDVVSALLDYAASALDYSILDVVYNEAKTGATNAFYGDGSVSAESSVTSSMTFNFTTIMNIVAKFRSKRYSGKILMVVHPTQFRDLLLDSRVQTVANAGNKATIVGVPEFLDLGEAIVFPFPECTTGTGAAGTTTHHAIAFAPNAMMIGKSDLNLEILRKELKDEILVSVLLAPALIDPNLVWKVVTA